MSTLNVNRVVDASGGVLAPISSVMRNRIINGAMVIDQRNAGASVTGNNEVFSVDRWQSVVNQTGKFTVQQNAGSVTPPSGYKKYLGVTSSSAYSVLTGDYFMISQRIEGYNFADLMFGTASAQTFTFSFWVRSSLTGTFGGSFQGAASATLRSYPFSYTISSANTWEQKTITVAGDTFTNTWDSTNGIGLFVNFGLGAGSTYSGTAGTWASANYANATGATSVVGTNGATFYITGVQLERGTQATSFEYRQYGTELNLCQRYCWVPATPSLATFAGVASVGASGGEFPIRFPVTMRSGPSLSSFPPLANMSIYNYASAVAKTPNSVTLSYATQDKCLMFMPFTGATGTAGAGVSLDVNTSGVFVFSAEL